MTRVGLFALLLLTGLGAVACGAQREDSSQGRGGAGGVSADDAGVGGAGGEAEPGDAAAGAVGVGDAAPDAGSRGAGGRTGPIVGMPLATFDATLDGFILNTDNSGVIFGIDGVQANLGGYLTGLPRAELSHDATAGAPSPGCLKLSVPVSGGGYFSEVLAAAGGQDWSGRVLHARVRVAVGAFPGVAQLFVTSSPLNSVYSTVSVSSDGSWQELTLDVSQPPRTSLGFDPTHIIEVGVQFHFGTAPATTDPIVFQVDSFSLEPPLAPPDASQR